MKHCKVNLGDSEQCTETAVMYGYCYTHWDAVRKIARQPASYAQHIVNRDLLDRVTNLEDIVQKLVDALIAKEGKP